MGRAGLGAGVWGRGWGRCGAGAGLDLDVCQAGGIPTSVQVVGSWGPVVTRVRLLDTPQRSHCKMLWTWRGEGLGKGSEGGSRYRHPVIEGVSHGNERHSLGNRVNDAVTTLWGQTAVSTV